MVEDIARSLDREGPRARKFHLRVDFVYWPYDYRREVSEDHLVLGAAYLDAERSAELGALLRSKVDQLAR